VIEGTITQRWARALIGLAQEGNQLAAVREQLNVFAAQLAGDDGKLATALESPSFNRKEKLAIVSAVIGTQNPLPTVRNFLSLAVEKDRARYIRPIIERFNSMADALTGRVKAHLTVAEKPSEATLEKIRGGLEKATQKKIELDVAIDPTVLGGAVVQLGSVVVDGSIRAQLARLSRELAGTE
jgi:F-type H+-transporting ATPase subunit delta